MTTQEIRARLKHCAGIMYGISSDLNQDDSELKELREEVKRLRVENYALRHPEKKKITRGKQARQSAK